MPLNKDTENILDPLLATFDDKLQADIGGQLAETYISGQAEMITWGKTKGGVPIAYEGPPISQAIDWAEKHGATLVKGIDEETKKRLAHTISQGIEQKRGIPGLSRDIRQTFTDMSKHRSELIARTETASALSQASLDSMEDMGIDGKEWVTAGDDLVSDDCLGNEAEGVIPAGQTFSGGVGAPPQHPDCRCVVAPARLPPGVKPPEIKGIQQAEKGFINQYGKAKSEYGQAIDSTGKAIVTKRGTVRSIKYSAAEMDKMHNAKSFIHNHPTGGTLSSADIDMAKSLNVGKMVAVDKEFAYTIKPIETWAQVPRLYEGTLKREARILTANARRRWRSDRTLTPSEINTTLQNDIHKVLDKISEGYHVIYTREKL